MKGNTDVWQTTASVLPLRRRARSQCIVSTTCCIDNNFSTHVKESGFRNPCNFCCGIRYPGLWNPEYSSKNPESYKGLESSSWNPESTAWNPESKFVLDSAAWGKMSVKPGRIGKGRFSIGLGNPHKIIKCFVSHGPPSREGGSVGRAKKKEWTDDCILNLIFSLQDIIRW